MNTETYEQFSLPADRVSRREFIKEGATVDILFYAEKDEPLTTEIQTNVELVVTPPPGEVSPQHLKAERRFRYPCSSTKAICSASTPRAVSTLRASRRLSHSAHRQCESGKYTDGYIQD